MPGCWSRRGPAFSLLELLLVMAIIALLAAIATPRLSRGTRGAADSALAESLRMLRGAIDHYATEHGGSLPDSKDFAEQLTTYTDSEGDPQAGRDATHIWGPYLRAIPLLPVGAKEGATRVKDVDAAKIGWIYDPATGTIRANCPDTEVDDTGKKCKDY